MKKTFIKDIAEGVQVIDYFLVSSKELLTTKGGNLYLSLILQDRTGTMEGRVWDRAQELSGAFQRDDFVKIDAVAETFRGALQLNIRRIRRCDEPEISPEHFLPASHRPAGEMQQELRSLLGEVENQRLKELILSFLDDEAFVQAFSKAPAAKGIHHAYIGGLMEHTICVIKLCVHLSNFYPGVERDLLLTAAFFHDVGKVRELTPLPTIQYSDEGRLLGHTLLGAQMVAERAAMLKEFPLELLTLLEHAIVSHHGLLEYGAVKLPMTMEALLLHYADDIDAKVNSFKKVMEEDRDPQSIWTAYNPLLNRYLYKGSRPSP